MNPIDLRSDTVTRPGHGMREAMARAPVGDDVYGEDPTVQRLEAMAADLLGKEAALFVPSGTMANQVALGTLTSRGDLVLAGEDAHILRYEGGAHAALWGLQIQTLGRGGLFDPDELRAAVPSADIHHARATVLALEDTHNVSGGRAWPLDQLEAVARTARDLGLAIHLDGARLFNAALATGVSAASIAAQADTVSFCLSKGLGAPVGSLVCADADRMGELRRTRKLLGGGMRQAGIIAAAGIYALEHHLSRLGDDHENATSLAQGLCDLGLATDPTPPETNIVVFGIPEGRFVSVRNARDFARRAASCDVLISPINARKLRAVTHLDVSADQITDALTRFRSILV